MERPIVDPPIPYVGPITAGAFKPGRLIRIQGNTPGVAYRFDINLQCGPLTLPRDDIAMQVSVRILDGFISLNSLQNGVWGEELQNGYQPVKRAEKFEIILMCDVNKYKLALNGQHFADFSQRIHYDCITHLTIEGDVSVVRISYESASASAAPAPSPTPVVLRQIDDDFEIINTQKASDVGFVHPPPYSEVTHGHPYSGLPPYPIHDAQGMPKPGMTPFPTGVPGPTGLPYSPSGGMGSPYTPPGAPGVPLDIPVPLNAGGSNYRSVQKSNQKKCLRIIFAVIIGIIIVITVVVSKVNRNKAHSQSNQYQYDRYGVQNDPYHNYKY